MPKKKYTIKDIAELAGVSTGTVDRVLHKRGKVSEEAQANVDKVLTKIEYRANPIARNLKNNKTYKICILIPDARYDPYWIPAHEGIQDAIEEFSVFGIMVDRHLYHPHSKTSFVEKAKEVIELCPDAILMPPIFQDESLSILKQCADKNIRVALFNNHIENLEYGTFIGQDLEQTGRIAADLIFKMVGPKAKIAIVHIDMEPHMQLKENGFKSYFQNKRKDLLPLEIKIFKTDNTEDFEEETGLFFKENTSFSAIFVTNSKTYKLVRVLEKNNHRPTLVGYDLLKENVDYLKEGKIDFLIHQKPRKQAYLAIAYFSEFFLFGKILPKQSLLPIDIITSENVNQYLE